MIYLLIGLALLGIVLAVAPRFLRRDGLDEVERFHRARTMTTEWSRHGVPTPVLVDDDDLAER